MDLLLTGNNLHGERLSGIDCSQSVALDANYFIGDVARGTIEREGLVWQQRVELTIDNGSY